MVTHNSPQNTKKSGRWRGALAGLLATLLLGLAAPGTSATAIGKVTHAVAVSAPFAHLVSINNDSGNLDHRMSLPTSSTTVQFLLPADVASMKITTVNYKLNGENFIVSGTATLDAQKRSVTLALPAGFFSVTPDHRPLTGPSDENGVPIHSAGYYGFQFSADAESQQIPQLGFGAQDSLSVNAVLERGTDSGERSPVFSLDRGAVDSVNTITRHGSTTTETVRKGDLVTVTGPRGFFTGTTRPFVSRQVTLGTDLSEDSIWNLPLPFAVSSDGSKITIAIRDRSSSTSDADVQPGAAPMIAITMLNGILFGPGDADEVAMYVPVRTTPGAPTVGTPTAGRASATVRWSTPSLVNTGPSDGGAKILGYRVRAFAGGQLVKTKLVRGAAESVVVTGLKNGTSYSFDVAAINRVGLGPVWRRSVPVRPSAD